MFAEPWQAQAFALAVTLSEQGHFTWNEWAAALAAELQAAASRGEPDDGSRYYEHWLAALENLVTAKGLADSTALLTRKESWAAAYRDTPHGHPSSFNRLERPRRVGFSLGSRARPRVLDASAMRAWGNHIGRLDFEWIELPPVGLAASAGLGTLLGMRHALEPDHLAAVSTLMTGERSSAKAAWLGACWGLGHTLTLLGDGASLLVVFQAEMPAMAAQVFEFCVVLMLVGFGVRAICQRCVASVRASDAFPWSISRSVVNPSRGPTDVRTTSSGGRCTRTSGQRRVDGACGDGAPVYADQAGLSGAI